MIRRIVRARSWHLPVRIGIVTIAVAAVTALQLPIETEVPGEPFLLYLVVVAVSASALGRAPGFVAVAESTVASIFYFPPILSFRLVHAADLLAIEIYAVVAALTVEALCRLIDSALTEKAGSERDAHVARIFMREMSHRVANDLATVAAILRSGTAESIDAQSTEILRQALNQVNVFAAVHRELRFNDGAASLSGRVFIERLGKVLKGAIPAKVESVFEHRGGDFSLSQTQAITLGLIINELVMNSVKYAFLDRRDGKLGVSIHEHLGDCRVLVSDNGCGFDGQVRGTGKGTKLIDALARELSGVLDVRSSTAGTIVSITFPLSSEVPAISPARLDQGSHPAVH